jgi:hypothetical protein
VDKLQWKIRRARSKDAVKQAKAEATRVLGVLDRLTVRAASQAFGSFASVISRADDGIVARATPPTISAAAVALANATSGRA